jgi:hypothetical protein
MTPKICMLAALLAMLASCSGRFAGFGNCSADGSPVWYEYPNSAGSFDGIDNRADYCKKT